MTGGIERGAPRSRVLKGATIAYNNRFSSLPCTIRDMSDQGARLRIAPGVIVPEKFDLLVELDGIEAKCQVIWRHRDEIGVQFEEPAKKRQPKRQQVVTAVTPGAANSLRKKPLSALK